jgi:hypothetical protein
MKHISICFVSGRLFFCVSAVLLTSALIVPGGPILQSKPSIKRPSIYALGVQFDSTNAFVTDHTDNGPVFYETHTGGRNWNILSVIDGNKSMSWDWTNDLGVTYYNQGHTIFYYKNNYYDNKSKTIYQFGSVCLEGQDGFGLENKTENQRHSRLFRTFNGGKSWLDAESGNVPFDIINSFDPVTKNMIFACVNRYTADGRPQGEFLEMSLDAGKSWKEIGTGIGIDVAIMPDHVFFLDERRGWSSSDSGGGLFMTTDGGQTWRNIRTPERIVSSIFFKSSNNGRIIGGVSNNLYETVDGGTNWQILPKERVSSLSFINYFKPYPLSRWNDFAVRHTLLIESKH